MGPRWVLWRAGYALRKKNGLLKRRCPPVPLDAVGLDDLFRAGVPTRPPDYRAWRAGHAPRFFFSPGAMPDRAALESVLTEPDRRATLAVADDFCAGRFLCYSRHVQDLGRPVDWLKNPFTGARHDATKHWCDSPTFSPQLGDVKDVWEPSRFACAFWLARAYALSGDAKYPAAFWELFEAWARQNPPNRGPHWKCGQETAIRLFAWCFALHAFWNCPATTAERLAVMVKLVAVQADRIAANIGYAVSQKNNHALSEATGLLTVGLLFPELRPAARWQATGREVLEREVRRQVYEDGSYVQHSMNYHRVMLHDCLWAMRLAQLNGRPLSKEFAARFRPAWRFLYEMTDEISGRTPNYGGNDGALVLPLSACDYPDHRPTIQAAGFLATGRRVLPRGPWDEALLWLFGGAALDAPEAMEGRSSRRFDAGGYYTLRGSDGWCMIRCHAYVDRPAHVDPLHVDLWHGGVNVLDDSGTYKYYTPQEPGMERYFKDIAAHNALEVDGRGPLDLVSRFLWLPWPRATCLHHSADRFEGVSEAYARAPWHVVHRRTIRLCDDHSWEIADHLEGTGSHQLALRWHAADGPFEWDPAARWIELELPCGRVRISLEGPAELTLGVHRGLAGPDRVAGWSSDYYAERKARPTIELAGRCTLPAVVTTRIRVPRPTRP